MKILSTDSDLLCWNKRKLSVPYALIKGTKFYYKISQKIGP